mmetsp:Transcript_5954/g.23557  ORF Transcript_5954/g.23557 Transcript_5954/m.23557 type:complete len:307 (-) Transcript_5954:3455-4375(-)
MPARPSTPFSHSCVASPLPRAPSSRPCTAKIGAVKTGCSIACDRRSQRRSRGPKEVICQLIEAIRYRPRRGQLLRLSHPQKHFGSGAVRNARCGVRSQHTRRHAHAATAVSPRLDGPRDRRFSRAGASLRCRRIHSPARRMAPPGLHPARGLASVRRDELSAARDARDLWWCRRQPRLPAGGAGRTGQGRDAGQYRGAHHRFALHPGLWHRSAKAALAAQGDERRDAGRHRDDRAGLRLGSEGHLHPGPARRRLLRDRRRQDLHHQRLHRKPADRRGAHQWRGQQRGVAVRTGDREPARLSCGPPA